MKQIPSIANNPQTTQKLATLLQSQKTWAESTDSLPRLTRRLSTTLALETQLGILADEIMPVVPFDSMNYRHKIGDRDFVFTTGMGGPHNCEYRLSLEGQNYGTLVFNRRKRFADNELQGIELFLSAAICPLRNACQFIAVEQAALTDSLTGVPNKRAMDSALDRASSIANRHGQEYSLILCDLDHFKSINDQHGHVIGDHVLQLAAREIEKAVRHSDEVYRFGGEEFAILLPHTSEADAIAVADRIREQMETISVHCGEKILKVTTSCGVAMHLRSEDASHWLARADEALYQAKASGRNCTRVFAAISG